MANSLMVSVVTITYNHENYIEAAINSILMQECDFDFELIVADDNSTDNTCNIIKEIIQNHSKGDRIRYIHHDKNVGMGANFIDAMMHSKGKYIAICEGDDYWTDSKKLQKQVDFLEMNEEYSMACHDALILNEVNNSSKLFFTKFHRKQICSTIDTLNIHFCPTASIVFRKQALLPIRKPGVEPMAGDHFLVQLLSLNGLIYRSQEVLSVYRKHEKGMSQVAKSYIVKGLFNKIETLKYINKISDNKFKKYIKIEIQLIKNRIDLLQSKTKYKTILLKIYRKILSKKRNYLVHP